MLLKGFEHGDGMWQQLDIGNHSNLGCVTMLILTIVVSCQSAPQPLTGAEIDQTLSASIDSDDLRDDSFVLEGIVQYQPGVVLPPDFPRSVPLYPGSRVVDIKQASDGYVVAMQSPDSRAVVVDWYRKIFRRWQLITYKENGTTRMIAFRSPQASETVNRRRIDINVLVANRDANLTAIDLSVGHR